jgi:hypothetical protein
MILSANLFLNIIILNYFFNYYYYFAIYKSIIDYYKLHTYYLFLIFCYKFPENAEKIVYCLMLFVINH